jgi:hypothetical protein
MIVPGHCSPNFLDSKHPVRGAFTIIHHFTLELVIYLGTLGTRDCLPRRIEEQYGTLPGSLLWVTFSITHGSVHLNHQESVPETACWHGFPQVCYQDDMHVLRITLGKL